MNTRPAAVTSNVRQRAQSLLSPLNLHLAGIAVVGVINLYLLVTVILLYNQAKGQDAEAVSKQEIALKSAKIASQPLEGLDVKLKRASSDADQFSMTRLPVSYSEIASELGALAKKQNVRFGQQRHPERPDCRGPAGCVAERPRQPVDRSPYGCQSYRRLSPAGCLSQ